MGTRRAHGESPSPRVSGERVAEGRVRGHADRLKSSSRMFDRERRRVERLLLTPPGTGQVQARAVRLLDIGEHGTRIEHDEPLIAGGPHKLRFEWDGDEIVVDCTVVHSEKNGHGFTTGVQWSGRTPQSIRRVVSSVADRDEMERLRKLVEASKLINSSIDADRLFASILTVARTELHVDRGTLYFVDEQKKEIWTKIAGELSSEIRLPIGKGLAGTVAETGEPVILHDAYDDPRFDRSSDQRTGYRTRSMLCVPITNRGQRALRVAAPLEDDLPRLVRRLNALVYRNTHAKKYVTFFFARYTPSTGALRYVNAGHNPAFVVGNGDPIELWSTGKPIGILPD